MEHTPTPWKVESGMIYTQEGIPIARMDREPGNGTQPVERDENARFIVQAVNLHDELIEALRFVCIRLELEEQAHPGGVYILAAVRQQMLRLLKKAGG